MLVEALVLDSDLGIYHLFSDLLQVYPYTVLGRIKLKVVGIPLAVLLKNAHMAGLVELHAVKIYIQRFACYACDIEYHGNKYHYSRKDTHKQQGK